MEHQNDRNDRSDKCDHSDKIVDNKLLKETQSLAAEKEIIQQMGGPQAIAKQHQQGKLTARERLNLLLEPNSFVEWGILGHHQSLHPDMQGKSTPADGVITGIGGIGDKTVCVVAYDFTVMGGSMGEVGERKVKRLREFSLQKRLPFIWLLDSAGARIQEIAGAQFADTGDLFYEQVQMSGVVPMVAAVMGPTAAGTSYIPALADFVPMVRGTSSMCLAGTHLVKAAINESVSTEDLGGSKIHCYESGVADLEVEDDRACLAVIRQYLSYFPSHNEEKVPRTVQAMTAPEREKFLQVSPDIYHILPEDPRRAYDMKNILMQIVDPASLLEIKPTFAKNIITALARIDGHSVGIVANQPKFMGGAIDLDASDKAAHFLWLCNAFHLPVVFLHDCPGFMVGSRMEKMGIIRHGAKFLHATSSLTVPKLSVVIRRSYGAGYFVMCGKGLRPDLIVGWPGCEIGLMSAEGATQILFQKSAVPSSEEEKEFYASKIASYRQNIGGQQSARSFYVDDIIAPCSTRKVLAQALEWCQHKKVPAAIKKHGVYPV